MRFGGSPAAGTPANHGIGRGMSAGVIRLAGKERRPLTRAPHATARVKAFRRARWHTGLVRSLRILLPLCALGTLSLYFVQAGLSLALGQRGIKSDAVEITSKDLKMVNPKYDGFTDDNGRYVVSAKAAKQSLKHTDYVDLDAVTAHLTQPDSSWANLVSDKGRYWINTQKLRLTGNIHITTSDGMKANLRTADLETKTRLVTSNQPVEVLTPNGTVRSDRMELNSGERHIFFRDNVVARLTPPAGEPQPGAEKKQEKATHTSAFAAATNGSNGPIDISSAVLEIRDNDKLAIFSGGVKAVQAGSTLTAGVMRVTYSGNAGFSGSGSQQAAAGATAAPTPSEVQKLEAEDNVVIADTAGRKATAARSLYDRKAQTMTLSGQVIVSQSGSVLSGDTMIVDLATNVTHFPPGTRIKGHFAGSAEQPAAAGSDTVAQAKAAAATVAAAAPDDLATAAGSQISSMMQNDGAATDIEANQLDVDDTKGLAIFRGDVIATRSGHQIKAQEMQVAYDGGGDDSAVPGSGNLRRIDAKTKIVVSSASNQVVTGDWLQFDAKTQVITIGGNVVVSQAGNVIKGEKLVVDLASGRSHFEVSKEQQAAGKTRVKMLITRGGDIVKSLQSQAGGGAGLPPQPPSQ